MRPQPYPYFLGPLPEQPKQDEAEFYKEDDSGKVRISPTKFYRYLSSIGYRYDGVNERLIYIKDNVYRHAFIAEITMDLRKRFDKQEDVLNELIKKLDIYLRKSKIALLNPITIVKYHDPDNVCRLFFKNKYVEISKDGQVFKDYKDADFMIPESKIVKHVIFEECGPETDFAKFMKNISTDNDKVDEVTLQRLRSSMAYLLHNNKSSDVKPIILLTDYTKEKNHGGTGKSLILKALSIPKGSNMVSLNGKEVALDSKFRNQNLTLETELVGIDDLKVNFNPEGFYGGSTWGIQIERKGKTSILLSIEDSPKHVFTSNSVPLKSGDSTIRRFITIELKRFYNANHRPIDDFDKLFFDQWNEDEFNSFFHYLFGCIQEYFANGKVIPEPTIGFAKEKMLINDIGVAMYEFLESLELDRKYTNSDLLDNCHKSNTRLEDITATKIALRIKKYAEFKDYEVVEKNNGERSKILKKKAN